jgi:hypothetical protein
MPYLKRLLAIASVLSLFILLSLAVVFISDHQRVKQVSTKIAYYVANYVTGRDSVSSVAQLYDLIYRGAGYKLRNEKIPQLYFDISFIELSKLEKQRKGLMPKRYVNAVLTVKEYGSNEPLTYKVKMRSKGDREMHRLDISSMSLKVDIKGSKRLFGIEEFSLQKPIVRNYTWEPFLHRTAKTQGILSLKQIPVRVFRNGNDLGIFFIEEGFAKELIETQFRKNGPIIGIDELTGLVFPNVNYEFYSKKKMIKEMPEVYDAAKEQLSLLKRSHLQGQFNLSEFFLIDKWAKFFALSDLFGSFHATVPKSVKLYYNASNGLFEPIAFDAHIVPNSFEEFILLDFITISKPSCDWICRQKDWYNVFLQDAGFLNEYIKWLKYYSSEEFIISLKSISNNEIEPINDMVYSEFSLSDLIEYKGILPFYFDDSHVIRRANLIKSKLAQISNTFNQNVSNKADIKSTLNDSKCVNYHDNVAVKASNTSNISSASCSEADLNQALHQSQTSKRNYRVGKSNNLDLLSCNNGCTKNSNSEIVINSGLWAADNTILEVDKLFLSEGTTIILTGNTKLSGINNKSKISGPGMLVQIGGSIHISNLTLSNLKSVKVKGMNWSSGLNIIDSNATIDDVVLTNSASEDAINIVNSKTSISEITIKDSVSDGIDIDFGELTFQDIHCINIGNDCLDTSGASVQGVNLEAQNVGDKLLSFGEISNGYISNIIGDTVGIVVVSKDGSTLKIGRVNATSFGVFAASFNKKEMFGSAKLTIDDCVNCSSTSPSTLLLVGKNSLLTLENAQIKASHTSQQIENLMYGKVYGKATRRNLD